MTDETFQGRKNMETWDVAAVSDNDRALYNAVTRIVAAHEGDEATRELADRLKDFFERKVEESDESAQLLTSQLVSSALSRVDWRELAEEWLREVREEDRVDVGDPR
jgi:hypothetical protein